VPQEEIVDGYLEDLEFYRQYTGGRQVSSIFFGGGTPSLMEPRQVGRLIDYINSVWGLMPEAEISLEANPNSHYPQMFADLHRAGINRLSLGVQALNDDDLRFLGRTHNLKQAYAAVDEVLKNFDNHSIDLIYARPNQSLSSWEKELKQAAAMGLKHISLYQLTIEDGTVFSRKGIKPLDDEAAAEMYLATENLLQPFDYQKYEVSNYALPGFESRHNLLYWTGQDYIGVGPSAHGRLTVFNGDLKQNSGARNSRAHDKLKQNLPAPVFYATTHRCRLEKISAEERAEELLLMGLRLVFGIDKAAFEKNCGIRLDDFVNRRHLTDLAAGGWLEDSSLFLRATAKGFPVLNFLIEQLVSR